MPTRKAPQISLMDLLVSMAPKPMPAHYPDLSLQAFQGPPQPVPSHSQLDRTRWDPRPDGTAKQDGYFGVLQRPDGGVMSEFSVADSDQFKDPQGHYMDYPSLVPTLTQGEVSYLLNMREGDTLPPSIYQKAEAFALQRRAQGKPLFAGPGEQNYTANPQFKRVR